MKIFNLIFCILFIFFAILQYNDPDPYIWIPIYLFAAFLCWMAYRGKHFSYLYTGSLLVLGAYALWLFVEKDGVWDWITKHDAANITGSMHAETPWIEDAREFFGLLIIMIVIAINYLHSRKLKKRK